jgi:spermidine synthase
MTRRTDPPRRSAPPDPPPPSRLPAWAAACFLLSGAAGLLYEVVWSKELSHLLGNSLHSISTVVAAFLAGLAVGAAVLGARLARRRQGARLYGLLEVGIALLGLASVPVLRGLDPLLGALYRALGGESPAFLLARFAVVFALLLPPTLLMGATLPVLVAHFEYRVVGSALARLYAVNTVGAVTGSLLAGFWLIPTIGLLSSSWAAAALNLAAAAIALIAARGAVGSAGADAESAPAADRPESAVALLDPDTRLATGVLFALSGFAALAFQIAWVRLFGLLFGSSVYSFAAVLAIYLLGLALGGALAARGMRSLALSRLFALLQLAVAVSSLAAVQLFPWLPDAFLAIARGSAGDWWRYFGGQTALVAAVLALPCVLLGAVFPLATRLLQTRDSGHATGLAYAVNTAGTLAGSLGAGFVLIPWLGVQGTHLAACAISALVGLAALALAARAGQLRGGAGWAGVGLAAACLPLWLAAPAWNPTVMSSGIYRPYEAARVAMMAGGGGPGSVRRAARAERVLFYREGVNGSVYVGTDSAGRNRWMRVGGKVEASTHDMKTQVLLGLLPVACSPAGGRACLVGLGSGITAAAALAGGPGPFDVIEIEREVVEASRLFHAPGADPLEDQRVRLLLTDARTHLTYDRATYDVLMSAPSNPWIAGLNNLFTVDFYRRVRQRLAPGGVFCQWVQLYEMSPETFGTLLASFLAVFPHGYAFQIYDSNDVLLLALPPGRALDLARLREPRAAAILTGAGLLLPEGVAAFYACPFDSLDRLARGTRLNTDDLPLVEYRAPLDLYRVGQRAVNDPSAPRIELPAAGRASALELFAGWPVADWYLGRFRQLARQGFHDRALAAARAAAGDGLPERSAEWVRAVEADRRRRAVSREHEAARAEARAGRMESAATALRRAAALDPGDGRTWVLLAEASRALGLADSARASAARAMAVGDSADRGDAEIVLGLLEVGAGRHAAAAERFRAAQRWRPAAASPYRFEAQALRDAGDRRAALAACLRGLQAAPGDPQLEALYTELATGAGP